MPWTATRVFPGKRSSLLSRGHLQGYALDLTKSWNRARQQLSTAVAIHDLQLQRIWMYVAAKVGNA